MRKYLLLSLYLFMLSSSFIEAAIVPVAPGPTLPSTLPLSKDECMTKSQSDGQNAQAGYMECIKKNLAKDCQKQLDQQNKMILATYQSCITNKNTTNPVDCNTCKENFCANETVSCDKAKAEAACATECKSGSEGDQTVMGITMGPKCLKNGQCSFKIYDLLGLKQDMPAESRVSATFFVQDILLAATFFIGTIITIALIWSGVMYILAGATGKDPANAKNGITYSVIGLVLVISSYAIIRLVQYIAKGF